MSGETPITTTETETAAASHPIEPFIDKNEVARRLNKTPRTVDNWMKLGILPYYKIRGSIEFKWSVVEKQLAMTCRVFKGAGGRTDLT